MKALKKSFHYFIIIINPSTNIKKKKKHSRVCRTAKIRIAWEQIMSEYEDFNINQI